MATEGDFAEKIAVHIGAMQQKIKDRNVIAVVNVTIKQSCEDYHPVYRVLILTSEDGAEDSHLRDILKACLVEGEKCTIEAKTYGNSSPVMLESGALSEMTWRGMKALFEEFIGFYEEYAKLCQTIPGSKLCEK